MKVYLSGPMRGLPEWNRHSFEVAEKAWKEAGHQVFSPLAVALAQGYEFGQSEEPEDPKRLRHVILGDMLALSFADAIVMLPAWETSRGATAELAFAQFLGLPIFCAKSFDLISPDRLPWNELAKYLEGFANGHYKRTYLHPSFQYPKGLDDAR